jgi:hypothetical protein
LEVELPPGDAPRTPPPRKKRVGVVDLDDEAGDPGPEPEPRPRPRPRRRRRSSGSSGGGRRVLLGAGGVVVVLLVLGGIGWGMWRVARGEPEFKEFSPPGGEFTVLMPGDPDKKGVGFGGLALTAWEGDRGGVTYVVGYDDGPGSLVPIDNAAVAFAESVGKGGGGFEGRGGLGGAGGWLEFQIEADNKSGYCSGRVCLVRNRLYALLAHGKEASRTNPEVRRFLDSFKLSDGPLPWEDNPEPAADPPLLAARPAPKADPPEPEVERPAAAVPKPATPKAPAKTPRKTVPRSTAPPVETARGEMLGGSGDPAFRDPAPTGGLLVGFDVGLEKFAGYPIVGAVRPIYRVGEKDSSGNAYGTKSDFGVRRVLAKPGYAVGAITARTGAGIDGFSVTFMRVAGNRLDPSDAYESEWVGNTTGGGGPKRLSGDGAPAVGLLGRQNKERVTAIGLLFPGR